MATNLMDLNYDCQMQVIRACMLSEEVMITRLYNTPSGLILRSTRPAHANALSQVSSTVHNLYEEVVHLYQVFELRVDGFSLANSIAGWTGVVPSEKVRYLRLVVEYRTEFRHGFTHNDIPTYTPQVFNIIKKFPELRDLELVVFINTDHAPAGEDDRIGYRGVRGHVLTGMPRMLQAQAKLVAIRTSYAGIAWKTSTDSTNKDLEYMAKTSKKKTAAGWRMNMKATHMFLNPR